MIFLGQTLRDYWLKTVQPHSTLVNWSYLKKKARKRGRKKGAGISLLPLGFPVVRREIQDEVRGGKAEYIRTVNIWGNYFLSIQMDFSHTLLWNPMTNFPEWSHAKRVVNYLFFHPPLTADWGASIDFVLTIKFLQCNHCMGEVVKRQLCGHYTAKAIRRNMCA